MLWISLLAALAADAHAASTVVSLTFDDGRANTYPARSILASHGMHGTFYLNSANIGSDSYYMTWPQIDSLAADGNEIGGHTLHHTDLTSISPDQAKTEVCDDRAALLSHGYNVTSFAYPEINYNATVQQIVKDCGYSSGRGGDDREPWETIPPADPYALRTVPAVDTSTTLANMERYVTDVENSGGGWVIFMFHSVCSNCGTTLAVSPTNLSALLDWLAPRSANGTVVRPVAEVMKPPTDAAPQNTSTPKITGSPQSGQTLTTSDGTWSGYPTPTYAYQWNRCASTCSPISGATKSSYTLTADDVGNTITATVTATNASGSASATSDPTASVTTAPSQPVLNGGFEAGSLASWTAAGAKEDVTTSAPHLGSYAALLGASTPTNGDSTIAQTFTVPSGATTVSFWYAVNCPDSVKWDWATAKLKDNTTGTTTTPLAKTCNTTNTWKKVSAAVTAGHSYTLTLVSHDENNPGDATSTKFDDVGVS